MKNTSGPVGKIEGVVTASACACCGHHEIGIVIGSGDYILRMPGMQVRIIDRPGHRSDDSLH